MNINGQNGANNGFRIQANFPYGAVTFSNNLAAHNFMNAAFDNRSIGFTAGASAATASPGASTVAVHNNQLSTVNPNRQVQQSTPINGIIMIPFRTMNNPLFSNANIPSFVSGFNGRVRLSEVSFMVDAQPLAGAGPGFTYRNRQVGLPARPSSVVSSSSSSSFSSGYSSMFSPSGSEISYRSGYDEPDCVCVRYSAQHAEPFCPIHRSRFQNSQNSGIFSGSSYSDPESPTPLSQSSITSLSPPGV